MSARRILGAGRSQGLGCSPIKAVRELGSERRGQFGPYPPWALEFEESSLVREGRDEQTSGVSVVVPTAL